MTDPTPSLSSLNCQKTSPDDIQQCRLCKELYEHRRQVVLGDGPVPCDIMYVARNPGVDEDRQGRCLVGTAGSMAMWILARAGYYRDKNIFLDNVVKCHTPNDRVPYGYEIENCRNNLARQILAVKPRVIVSAGGEATSWFAPYLDGRYREIERAVSGPISDIRGIPFRVNIHGHTAVVVPTFHPSFVSRMQHVTKKNAKKGIYNAKPVAIADIMLAKRIAQHGWKDKFVTCNILGGTSVSAECPFAIDLETTGLDPRRDDILGFAVSDDGRSGTSFTYDRTVLQHYLESDVEAITQNGSFDYQFAIAKGVEVNWNADKFDTMFAAHAIAPDLLVNLGFINSLHAHFPPWKAKTKGKMHDTVGMDESTLHERCIYDAAATFQAKVVLENDLRNAGLYESPFRRLYMPMLPIVTQMEFNGVLFDRARAEKLVTHFFPQYKRLVDKWSAEGVDIASNKQVGEFLVSKGTPLTERTPSGNQWRVDDDVLGQIRGNALVNDIRLFRKVQKILTTDLLGMLQRVDPQNVLRTSWDLTGTGTGRFSSIDPDVQNIRLGLRHLYVARPGHYLFGFDYKGMELYVAALLAGDFELVEQLLKGRDPHEEKRREIYGRERPVDDVLYKSQRRIAKEYNFGPLYGKSKFGLARDLHVTQAEAERFLATSVTQRPKFIEWRALQSELAYGDGAVYSALGRRRLLFADRIETQAYNSPVQMTAHDITLETMILIYRELRLIPWVQNHDQIVYELPIHQLHLGQTTNLRTVAYTPLERRILEIATRPIIELNNHHFPVDAGRGLNWKQIDVGTEDIEE